MKEFHLPSTEETFPDRKLAVLFQLPFFIVDDKRRWIEVNLHAVARCLHGCVELCIAEQAAGEGARSPRSHTQLPGSGKAPPTCARGRWWVPVGWVIDRQPHIPVDEWPPDLGSNPLLRWQRRWYWPLAFGVGFGLPMLIGFLCGDMWAGLFWGGFTRIVALHHSTFSVNSLAHMIGTRPYSEKESARDNALVAFIAVGEGFHNFHHTFMSDWRNGIRWYHYDPAKWWIGALSKIGLTYGLHTTPAARIETKRLETAISAVEPKVETLPRHVARLVRGHFSQARERIEQGRHREARRAQRRALRIVRMYAAA